MTARDHTSTERDAGRYARHTSEYTPDAPTGPEEDFTSSPSGYPCLECGQVGRKRTDHAEDCRTAKALWGEPL